MFDANVFCPVIDPGDVITQELFDQLKRLSQELLKLIRLFSLLPRSSPSFAPIAARRLAVFVSRRELSEAGVLADIMSNLVEATFEEKLRLLSALHTRERLERVIELLNRQVNETKRSLQITNTNFPSQDVDIDVFPPPTGETVFRRVIRSFSPGILPPGFSSPGDGKAGDNLNEIDELKKKLDDAKLTVEAQQVADKDLKRLRKMNPAQTEYGVCRTYLETLSEIPWTRMTDDRLGIETLQRARKQLDDDHYGLEKIKKRLLEYLAVLKLKQEVNANMEAQAKSDTNEAGNGMTESHKTKLGADATTPQTLEMVYMVDKSPILLLVGPPGTGKTSLAKSVAAALGRKFHRISLGGVRDEAEIRGHRRTYVAAMPGLIVNGLKKVGVSNPVFLLDEIDKVSGSSFHGDPSAAMLEVLDPEQNHTFVDHYVNIPLDLSKVLFIATANSLDTIPPPLLDRMETITISGYTTVEKRHIANRHLIAKQIRANGLTDHQVRFTDNVVDTIITSYTRESGVRNLEREIGSVCRYKAVQYAEAIDASTAPSYQPTVTVADLSAILGVERFDEEVAEHSAVPGIVTGLVAYSFGGQGSILFVEVADMPGGSGRVQLTGKLGDVLKESVEVALTWVKAHAFDLGLTADSHEDIMQHRSVHVHCPSGAIPKDGPSAGLAHTLALVSLFSGRAVPPSIAMTGEVSLRGRVLPVGGVPEKLIGALRAGVKTVLLPVGNRRDVVDLPGEVKDGLEIVFVGHIWDALRFVWADGRWAEDGKGGGVESRL